jgi:hypothetical protein
MIKKYKYYLLSIITFCIVFLNSCQKEKIIARHIVGHVSDYFDGNDVEGVKVGLVYSYFPPNSFGPYEYTPAPGVTQPPCAESELLEITTTDKYGEFHFSYHPKVNLDDCPYGGYHFNYYLVFEKEGTDYFLQSEKINREITIRKKIEYKMRPYIKVDFNISNTLPTTPVLGSVRVYGNPYYYENIIIDGTNINSTYTINAKWTELIEPGCSIVDSLSPFIYYYSFREEFIPTKKHYVYDINY